MLQQTRPAPTRRAPLGTPTQRLDAMSFKELQERFHHVACALLAPNKIPHYLRAPDTESTRRRRHSLTNEHGRIRTVAERKGWTLQYPTDEQICQFAHLTSNPDKPLEKGDRVHAIYRNPDTPDHELVESDGTILKIENWGATFITQLDNGQKLPLSKRNLTRI